MKISQYGSIVRRNAFVLVVLLTLAVAAALLLSLLQTPKYKATAVVYVTTQQATNLNDLAQGVDFGQQIVRSYATIIPTPLVLNPVIQQLKLDTDAYDLADEVDVEVPLETVVMNITVTDASSADAARIANAIVTSLSSTVSTLTPPTADSVEPVRITVAQRAVPPTAPTTPNVPLNLAVGVVAALALTVFIAVLRDALRKRAAELQGSTLTRPEA